MTRLLYNKYHKDVPPNAVGIMRGTPWGNKYIIGVDGDRNDVCDLYEHYAMNNTELVDRIQRELYQRPLVCCCWPHRCHGDTIIYLANYCRKPSVIILPKWMG